MKATVRIRLHAVSLPVLTDPRGVASLKTFAFFVLHRSAGPGLGRESERLVPWKPVEESPPLACPWEGLQHR